MANLIISYPTLNSVDFDWIQSIREKNDQKYFNVVKPHVTLLFSTNKLNSTQLLEHAQANIGDYRKVPIVLDSAIVVEDDSKTFFHTFLVPSTGFDEINELHDRLYQGAMTEELRLDIPFIPHLGIGTSGDEDVMKRLADELNSKNVRIVGTLDTLCIVQFDGVKVIDIDELLLK